MPQKITYERSTLVQGMTWCHQLTSHYLNQCWPRSLSPYGITRPQWVNQLYPSTKNFVALKKKTQTCHDANFVISGDTLEVLVNTASSVAANDDKVGIMTIVFFFVYDIHYHSWLLEHICVKWIIQIAISSSWRWNILQHGISLIARFMGPTWGPAGADRTQVGPMLAPWTLLSGMV